jgi:hypothetical protein
MMKIIYSILILFFSILAVLCFNAFFSMLRKTAVEQKTAPPVNKSNLRQTANLTENKTADGHSLSLLLNSNIFNPARGETSDSRSGKKQIMGIGKGSFILQGIYSFGGHNGAIIVTNQAQLSQRGTNKQSKTIAIKNFYKIGDEVGDGYKLSAVSDKSVVLKNEGDELVLSLRKDDNDSSTETGQKQGAIGQSTTMPDRVEDMKPIPQPLTLQ